MTIERHRPVLLEESLDALAIKPGGLYLDGTFGRGGHSRAILRCLGPDGRLFGIDRDPDAVSAGRELEQQDGRFSMTYAAFSEMEKVAEHHGMAGRLDGVLLDLGVSSPQLDDAARGFSFLGDGPLDMRMDPQSGESAAEWLAGASEEEIVRVLRIYGEERFARRIARAVLAAQSEEPLLTTGRLARVVDAAVPVKERGKHPATRTFQALRIHLNRELGEIEDCLAGVCDLLATGGRLVVISFHSLEDRIVKRFIRDQSRGEVVPRGVPVTEDQMRRRMRALGKPVRPSFAEVAGNVRSRSAIMRVAERLQ